MKRREFLGVMTVAAGAGLESSKLLETPASATEVPPNRRLAPLEETIRGDMRYRKLGRTGEEVSAIGLGGYHVGSIKDEREGIAVIRGAIDSGITFMDNSWDYHNGGSEIRMGKALGDGYRKKVFLMTKIDGRTKEAAAKQIDESLKRLQTDVIDLLQHHEVIRLEDPDRIFAEGGAQEAMLAAQGRQNSLHRFHGTQGPHGAFADAGNRR